MNVPLTEHMQRIAKTFIERHRNADTLVVDMRTGLPHKAIYDTIDCFGRIRQHPVVAYFDEEIISRWRAVNDGDK